MHMLCYSSRSNQSAKKFLDKRKYTILILQESSFLGIRMVFSLSLLCNNASHLNIIEDGVNAKSFK